MLKLGNLGYKPGSGALNFNSPLLVGELPAEQDPDLQNGPLLDFGLSNTFLQPEIGSNLGSNSFDSAKFDNGERPDAIRMNELTSHIVA